MNSSLKIVRLDSPRRPGCRQQAALVAALISLSCLALGPKSAAQETPGPASINPGSVGAAPEPGPGTVAKPDQTPDAVDRPPHPGAPPHDRPERPERRGGEVEDERERPDRDRRRGRGSFFEGLTGEQQKMLREAMAEAWSDEDVVAARQQIEEGMEAYRNALRDAILKSAPELEGVLPEGFDGRGWLGDQRSAAMNALRSIMAGLPREIQEQARRRHSELMRDPEVAAAAQALDESYRRDGPTPTGSRYGMTEQERVFRSAYVAALVRQIPEAAEFLNALRESSGRGPLRRDQETTPDSEP